MKAIKREFLLSNLTEIIEYFQDEKEFKIRLTNYSTKLELPTEKIFFSDSKPDKSVFSLYNKMKSEIQGEIRTEPKNYQYFNFSGLKKFSGDCFCVDINSAYLTVLKNENIISQSTYDYIFSRTQGDKKENRLKAVGMFAKNPIEIIYHNGIPFSIQSKKDPYSWVFFTAVHQTFLAMEAVKKEMKKEFLFYWVDGIFLKGNPEKAVQILNKLGFQSKIEEITEFINTEGIITYKKDSEEKMLFLPKSQKEEKTEYLKLIEKKI